MVVPGNPVDEILLVVVPCDTADVDFVLIVLGLVLLDISDTVVILVKGVDVVSTVPGGLVEPEGPWLLAGCVLPCEDGGSVVSSLFVEPDGFNVVSYDMHEPQHPNTSKRISCTESDFSLISLIRIHLAIIVS